LISARSARGIDDRVGIGVETKKAITNLNRAGWMRSVDLSPLPFAQELSSASKHYTDRPISGAKRGLANVVVMD